MFTALRPVGNKIKLKTATYSNNVFHPYKTKHYQSGTAALASAIIAAVNSNPNIKEPTVLLPAYACPDLISAIEFANAKPILIDLEKNTPWMGLEEIQSCLPNSVVAIIAVNFLGIPERMSLIKELIKDTSVILIEDSAQSLPLSINSDYWQGDLMITSFGRGKPLSLLGGGAIFTQNEGLFNLLPSPTITKYTFIDTIKYTLKIFIYNFITKPFIYFWLLKLPGLQIGKTVYKKLTAIKNCPSPILNLVSANLITYSNRILLNKKIHEMLQEISSDTIIDLPHLCKIDLTQPLLRYPFLVLDRQKRNNILSHLNRNGLGASTMYTDILPNIEGVRDKILPYDYEQLSANKFAQHLITIPTHADVTNQHINKIKQIIEQELMQNAS